MSTSDKKQKKKNRKGATIWKAKSILGFFIEALEVELIIIIIRLREFSNLLVFFYSFKHYFF